MNSTVKLMAGIFIILHGLVHLWYVVLSQKLIPFQEEMGWTGESWLLPKSKWLATIFFSLSALIFVIGGISFIMNASYWRPLIITSSIFSSLTLVMFWDGSLNMLVEKGLIGLLINIGTLVILFF